jgi:O-antigen/teichoic acid export membrane protein
MHSLSSAWRSHLFSDNDELMQGVGGRIVKNIRVMLIGQLITWAISFVWIIYLPAYIGATDMGRLAIANAIWAILSPIINTGTATHLIREIARSPDKATELLGTALIQRYIIILICCVLVVPYVHFMQYSKETVILIAIVAMTMPATHTITTLNAIFQGREVMQYMPLIDILTKGLILIFSLVCMYLGWGINEIVAGSIAATASAVVLQFLILRNYMPIRITWNSALSTDMLWQSLPYCASSLVLNAYSEIDKLIMPIMVSEKTVGWYSVAAALAGTLIFIPNILATAIFPALSRGAAEAGDSATRILRKSFDFALMTGVPIGFGLAIVANPLVDLLYQSKFPQSGPVLSILSITLVFTYVASVVGRFLVASGRTNMWTLTMVAGIVLAFPLNFILVPWAEQNFGNGAIGAALRFLCAEFLMAAFAVWMLPSGTLTRENASVAFRIFVAGGVMVGACSFFMGMFIAVPVLVGVATYSLMILVLRVLKPDDMDMILNATRGALAGLRLPLPSGRRRE